MFMTFDSWCPVSTVSQVLKMILFFFVAAAWFYCPQNNFWALETNHTNILQYNRASYVHSCVFTYDLFSDTVRNLEYSVEWQNMNNELERI
jgi:hypothetical protein